MAGPAPWSAFPSATHISNTDTCAVVQGGVNKKCPRSMLLISATGEDLTLRSQLGTLTVADLGSIIAVCGPGQAVTLTGGLSAGQISVFDDGHIAIIGGTGQQVGISSNGGFVNIDGAGALHLHSANGVPLLDFTPAHPGDWTGGVADLVSAINRIARVVSNNGATPIP
jgi:hypothetical protein